MRTYLYLIAVTFAVGLVGTKTAKAKQADRFDAFAVLREFDAMIGSTDETGVNVLVKIERQSTSLAAYVERNSDFATLTVTDALIFSSRTSVDGLRMTLCHELGHILGGAPRRDVPLEWDGPVAHDGRSEISAEGQADYYASLVCFPRLVRGHDHKAALAGNPVQSEIGEACDRAHGRGSEDSLICRRSAAGGHNMLTLVRHFQISSTTPSQMTAPSTITNSYPDRQCRLDTILAGSRCSQNSRPHQIRLDFDRAEQNECLSTIAARPKCWYRR